MNTTFARRRRAYERLIRLILGHGASPRRRHRKARKSGRTLGTLSTMIRRLIQQVRR